MKISLSHVLLLICMSIMEYAAGKPLQSNNMDNRWQPLFKTAEDTVHWTSVRDTPFPNEGWQIKKKELILLSGRKGGDIITKRKYADFELKLEFKMTRLVNSGVKYLVHQMFNNDTERMEWIGFEYQIIDDFHQNEIQDYIYLQQFVNAFLNGNNLNQFVLKSQIKNENVAQYYQNQFHY